MKESDYRAIQLALLLVFVKNFEPSGLSDYFAIAACFVFSMDGTRWLFRG